MHMKLYMSVIIILLYIYSFYYYNVTCMYTHIHTSTVLWLGLMYLCVCGICNKHIIYNYTDCRIGAPSNSRIYHYRATKQ